jgi:type II secretory pathway component PulC
MCQSPGEALDAKQSLSDESSCLNCTTEHCAGAAVLQNEVLQIDRDQLRRRARCLGTHAEVQLHPRTSDGKVVGMALSGISEGSLFQAIGLQNKDLIMSINGAPADSTAISGLMSALGRDDDTRIEIVAKRGSEAVIFRFKLE